ncbi:MAG TPA: AAA family ATPase, partial [Stellaceae bacterium]|nr:AAA family ATPase [Stellaceae bacterium]
MKDMVAVRPAVTRLTLTDFRSYASQRLTVDPRPVVLVGPNGAGKTNLLEAISFLAPGRGLRRAKLGEVDRRGEGGGSWAVAATVEGGEAAIVEIGTGRDPTSESGEKRLLRIDGQPAKRQAMLGAYLHLVWLTPMMDRLFLEGAAPRRRFFDRLAYGVDPEHATRLGAYEQAMRERARLLRREAAADRAWLTALEETMAAHGIAVAAARRELIARLDAACLEAEGPFPRARLRL